MNTALFFFLFSIPIIAYQAIASSEASSRKNTACNSKLLLQRRNAKPMSRQCDSAAARLQNVIRK